MFKIIGELARHMKLEVSSLLHEQDTGNNSFFVVKNMVEEYCGKQLTVSQFADVYAQLTVYGLLIKKLCEHNNNNNNISIPLFDHIINMTHSPQLVSLVNRLHNVFDTGDVLSVIKRYSSGFPVEFFEDFLGEYDPMVRKRTGSYYTPACVAQFIVRSVDQILIQDFNILNGLADTMLVRVVDPAMGVGVFLEETINYVHTKKGVIPIIYGCELLITPYLITLAKLNVVLQEKNCVNSGEQCRVVVGDALTGNIHEAFPGLCTNSNDGSVVVVIGNPPWNSTSSNTGVYAQRLVKPYKYEPGGTVKLQERNPKHVNDDYVKFIALAEKMITENGAGIMGFITNNGYLDNPTFRGMRWHLRKSFDVLYVVNLHGNVKKREKTVDGDIDENVFHIQQGNSIIIAMKNPAKQNDLAKVFYVDVFGSRTNKFTVLDNGIVKYREVNVDDRSHSFIPVSNPRLRETYYCYPSVMDFFHQKNMGFNTNRDHFAVTFTAEEILERMKDFSNPTLDDSFVQNKYGLHDNRDWKLSSKRRESFEREFSLSDISQVTYRPFDTRYTFLSRIIADRPRTLMEHNSSDADNIVLAVGRAGKVVAGEWSLIIVSRHPINVNVFRRGGAQCCPLYTHTVDGRKIPNLNQETIQQLCVHLDYPPSDRDVISYIYGVLYNRSYRGEYHDFLAVDYPRIPPPQSREEFNFIKNHGEKLIELHLFTEKLHSTTTVFPVSGSNIITQITYKTNGTVWINDTQYFTGIPQKVWDYTIGGYPVVKHWLTDRKNLILTNTDIHYYLQVITAIIKTIEIQEKILLSTL